MFPAARKGFLGLLAALGLGWALLGIPGEAQAALTIVQTKGLGLGVCERVTGLAVIVRPQSGSQSNQCGAQNAAVLQISGGTANQSVTVTLPTSRTVKQTGFPNITVNAFTFATATGLTFGRTGTFTLDASGAMTIYVGATAVAQPTGAGSTYTGTATVKVL